MQAGFDQRWGSLLALSAGKRQTKGESQISIDLKSLQHSISVVTQLTSTYRIQRRVILTGQSSRAIHD